MRAMRKRAPASSIRSIALSGKKRSETYRSAMDAAAADLSPVLVGEVALPDGRQAWPVFHLMAERYLGADYAPEAVAERCGVPAATTWPGSASTAVTTPAASATRSA